MSRNKSLKNRNLTSHVPRSGTIRLWCRIATTVEGRVPATTKCRVLRFGAFELDLDARDLHKRGIRLKLAGQSFQALLLLLQRAPAVVTREELCQALWPHEPWGDHDHRLNKTINRVRDVLSDSADTPRFLETLPRVGYRFLVAVDQIAEVETAEPDSVPVAAPTFAPGLRTTITVPSPPAARRRLFPRLAVAVCLTFTFAFGAVLAYRFTRPKSERLPAAAEASPLTTYLGSELQPSFSPDGKQVAFIWNGEAQAEFHVYVMPVNGGASRQLTRGASSDYGPVWSPDARRIAFLRKPYFTHAQADQVRRSGSRRCRQGHMGCLRPVEPDQAQSVAHAEVVGEAAAQVVREVEAAARLAADDGLSLPEVRAGDPAADSRRAPSA